MNNLANLQDLYNKAQEQLTWVKLKDGESFEGEFVGVEEVSGFKGKQTNEFTFIVKGIQKSLQTSSFSLLRSMIDAGIKEKDVVKITRHGEGTETKYEAQKISSKK